MTFSLCRSLFFFSFHFQFDTHNNDNDSGNSFAGKWVFSAPSHSFWREFDFLLFICAHFQKPMLWVHCFRFCRVVLSISILPCHQSKMMLTIFHWGAWNEAIEWHIFHCISICWKGNFIIVKEKEWKWPIQNDLLSLIFFLKNESWMPRIHSKISFLLFENTKWFDSYFCQFMRLTKLLFKE